MSIPLRTVPISDAVPVSSVSYSSDMNCILAGCLDSAVRLLAKDTGELLGTYVATHTRPIQVGVLTRTIHQ